MDIFYIKKHKVLEKKYTEVVKKIEVKEELIASLSQAAVKKDDLLFGLMEQSSEHEKLKEKYIKLKCGYEDLTTHYDQIQMYFRSLSSSNGGYVKQNNKLKKLLEEANARIKDLESNRYLKKQLKPARPALKQSMGVKRSNSNGQVKKILASKTENRKEEQK